MHEAEHHDVHRPSHREGSCVCRLALQLIEDRPPIDELTGREKEVLALLGGGLTNRILARKLGIAERTVKAHIAHIITKLGLASRLEAALIANVYHELICPERREAMERSVAFGKPQT
ncbi:helix-turn-helix transcriptional regulator [Streptomyces spectabilis]|uniref:helix-turn-helix transcriptional regulator n=1 Tax=Streptomyces spectabilis TaxID=68270 RepID=UPI0033C99708